MEAPKTDFLTKKMKDINMDIPELVDLPNHRDKPLEDTTAKHKAQATGEISIAIITVSSSRDVADDESGNIIKEIAKEHRILRHIVLPDKGALVQNEVKDLVINTPVDAIIVNGGTGIMRHDVTVEALRPLFIKELTGFSAAFSALSFQEIGSAAIMSRATAGIFRATVVFVLPGSPRACKLAMEKLIMPELGHFATHLRSYWER